jgi:NAD-dependent dihydropyrimidine dehydrogenase PreA subunit
MAPSRKKKIKTLLARMNRQNKRFIPVAPPLVEMMDMTTSDAELDYLLTLGPAPFDYEQAARAAGDMPDHAFAAFFDIIKRKGLVHTELLADGREEYRLNAIAVGWYEAMMFYLVGHPVEKAFSEKWDAFFRFFQKFNVFPLRSVQNVFMRGKMIPNQGTALLNPEHRGKNKRKTIPINTEIGYKSLVYPAFKVDELVEEHGDRDGIYAFPCVCRHGQDLIDSACSHDLPELSCMSFGGMAAAWEKFGYGRRISKTEAFDMLKEVRDKGAVHSVVHDRDDYRRPIIAICNCCWDCCGILKPYNMGSVPLMYHASYAASIKADADCKGCGNCERFCPTTAMRLADKKVSLKGDKCIGCGQCALQCRQNNIEMYPSERTIFLPLLKKSEVRIAA